MDSCGSLFFLVGIIALITAGGHGLWLLVSAAFHAVLGDQTGGHPTEARPRCPACAHLFDEWTTVCPHCKLQRWGKTAQLLTDLAGTARQLQRFAEDGLLDPSERDRLLLEVHARQRRIRGLKDPVPAPIKEPAPAPEPAPAILATCAVEVPLLPEDTSRSAPPFPHATSPAAEVLEVAPVAEVPLAVDPAPPKPPPVQRQPRRPLSEILAAFMEQKNILWGELLGGLLIVGCSIALVISLWQQVEKIPYYPFVIFGTITAALFGAGLYTLHHWKLASTSWGLLLIATLLVPLNLLVVAGLHRGDPSRGTVDFLTEFVVTGVFVSLFLALLVSAGRVLLPGHSWLLPVAVLGTSLSQLLVSATIGPEQPTSVGLYVLLGLVPTLCHGLSVRQVLRQTALQEPMEDRAAKRLLEFLGIASFALAITLGFQAYRSPGMALHWLAPILALAAVAPLTVGTMLHDRLTDPAHTMTRAAATVIALVAVTLMLAALALAWPLPLAVVLVGVFNFAALTGVGFRFRLRIAHAAALPCLALAFLTAFHSLVGNVAGDSSWDLLRAILSSRSGTALAVLVALLGIAAETLSRMGRRIDGAWYATGAGLLALVSLVLVTRQGLDDPPRAIIVYGLYGVGGLALNLRWQRQGISYLALGLLVGASLWFLPWEWPQRVAVWATVLAGEALLLAALRIWGERTTLEPYLMKPIGHWAAVATGLATCLGTISQLPVAGTGWWGNESPWLHHFAAAALAGTAFLLAGAFRSARWTWLGSALFLAGLTRAFLCDTEPGDWPRVLAIALLAHASLLGSVGLLARRRLTGDWPGVFAIPLTWSALLTSVLAVPIVACPFQGEMTIYGGLVLWLAGVWLVLAVFQRWPVLFAAFQAALCFSVGYGVTAWLEGQPWVRGMVPLSLIDPRSLQAYGLGLGLLSLAWVGVRIATQGKPNVHRMLNPGWPAVDHVVLGALVGGLLVLALWGIWPAVSQELTPLRLLAGVEAPGAPFNLAYGPGAWALWGLLTTVLLASLGERRSHLTILGLIVLAATAPVLAAGPFGADRATTAALRWGLAFCFLVGAVPLWLRGPLGRAALRLGFKLDPELMLAPPARASLIAWCVVPVFALTAIPLALRLGGNVLLRPVEGSFFQHLGTLASHALPLLLLGAVLVGHALHERSAGYAFAAGMLAVLAVTGGHAMHALDLHGAFTQADLAWSIQMGTIGAALWALAWLASRRWVTAWREDEPFGRPLMSAQLGLIALGNALLLVGGLGSIALWFPPLSTDPAQVQYLPAPWATQIGSLATWLALGLGALAAVYRSRQRQARIPAWVWGGIGMGAAVLVACSVEHGMGVGWGYRTLMLGSGGIALAWALAMTRRTAEPVLEDTSGRPRDDAMALGILAVVVFAVQLCLKAAIWHNDRLWAAAVIAVVGVAGAVVTIWQRREQWAFGSALLENLAASLLVWHFHLGEPLEQWWQFLLQANAAAGGASALLWLTARQRIYGELELKLTASPLLAAQGVLNFLCNLPWLGMALVTLFVIPDPGPAQLAHLSEVGGPWGCLAILLPFAAALWYAKQAAPGRLVAVAVSHALGFGILAACAVCRWDSGNWLAFHVLALAWITVGLLTLGVGLVTVALQLGDSPNSASAETSAVPSWLSRVLAFPPEPVQRWVEIIGILLGLLALRGAGSAIGGAYWSPGIAVTVAVLAVGLAVWSRKPRYVWESGLLFVLAGNLLWLVRGPLTVPGFLAVNILALALASAFWSAMELALRTDAQAFRLRGRSIPFNQVAALLGLLGMTLLAVLVLSADVSGDTFELAGTLTWSALAVCLSAVLLGFWEPENRWSPAGVYLTGLQALVLILHHSVQGMRLPVEGTVALAGFVLLATVIDRFFQRMKLDRLLRLPAPTSSGTTNWFASVQMFSAYTVAALSLCLALNGQTQTDRLLSLAATGMLVPAGIFLAQRAGTRDNRDLRQATIFLGVLLLTEFGCALLDPESAALGLHRSIVLLAALVVMTTVSSEWSGRLPGVWADDARGLVPVLGGLALIAVLAVLGWEASAYQPEFRRASAEAWAIVLTAVALVSLAVLAVRFAVWSAQDPLRLPESWLPVYVYTAEVLLALLVVHLRLTVPVLFRGFFAAYWTIVVLAIAFAGVGLSELCKRRGLKVLAEPLERTGVFLPLLPILAFWVQPAQLGLIDPQPHTFDRYALTWLLVAILYSLASALRNSFRFAFLAALAGNFALWSMWRHTGLSFLVHPQLWLIPVGLILLVAEHLNRDRLSPAQSLQFRYAALGLIYLSSTADMFIAGLGNSVGLPLWLMVLSVAGVLLGIVLRMQAYLFLGISFLCLDIFSMIWNAAVNLHHTWIWWASGIVLGCAILSLFAVFEKRRNDVLAMLEQIKGWQ